MDKCKPLLTGEGRGMGAFDHPSGGGGGGGGGDGKSGKEAFWGANGGGQSNANGRGQSVKTAREDVEADKRRDLVDIFDALKKVGRCRVAPC